MNTPQGEHLGNLHDLPVGEMDVAKTGGREILVIHLEDGIYALDNFCIHGGCRLFHGTLSGDTLRCPCHGSVFHVRTGEVLEGPATSPQPTYKVVIRDGVIALDS